MKGGMHMSLKDGKNPLEQPNELSSEMPSTPVPEDNVEGETKLGLSMLAKVALAVVILVSLIISISCLMKFNQLETQRKELEAELDIYNEAVRELQDIINSPMDDDYIIQQAKDKLGYYFPDENIYYQD